MSQYPVTRSDAQWHQQLSPNQFAVLRGGATEKPFTGEYDQHFLPGTYTCAGCGTELFSSSAKFDAGCGWPSFVAPLTELEELPDTSHSMLRTEIRCPGCGGHLGHVFDDGPAPTGQRYCVNSLSLDFVDEPADS